MHCYDNSEDRTLGAFWEKAFCMLAAEYGFVFTPIQLGRGDSAQFWGSELGQLNHHVLPDITIWSHPGQHHEIKHKNPTSSGMFGLEAYRYHALLDFANITKQAVLYTIHNHDLSGGRYGKVNKLAHWFTVPITELLQPDYIQQNGTTYINGARQNGVKILYFRSARWEPLAEYWPPTA